MENREKNISCNIFLEQIELLNQLEEKERGYVLYMALLKAFSRVCNQDEIQDDNQLENQLETIYISISKSISLSILGNTILNLLNKTLNCKIYNKNWGGKREGAGKTKKISEPIKDNPDLIFENDFSKCFEIYSDNCNNLIKLSFEKRNRETLALLDEVFEALGKDYNQYKELCLKANELVTIAEKKIDFKMMLRNYIGILNGKYKEPSILDGIIK